MTTASTLLESSANSRASPNPTAVEDRSGTASVNEATLSTESKSFLRKCPRVSGACSTSFSGGRTLRKRLDLLSMFEDLKAVSDSTTKSRSLTSLSSTLRISS